MRYFFTLSIILNNIFRYCLKERCKVILQLLFYEKTGQSSILIVISALCI
jgi:hypothetical protein